MRIYEGENMAIIDFKRVTKKVVETIATKIKCNFCNKCIKIFGADCDSAFFAGGEVNISYGYGSKYDGCVFGKIHICDKCAEKLKLVPSEMDK